MVVSSKQQEELNMRLAMACNFNELEKVKTLISQGANVRFNGGLSIQYASDKGYLDIVKLLVENGANVNDGLGDACSGRKLDVVKYLHQNGADIHTALIFSKGDFKEELLNYKTSLEEQKLLSNDLKEIQAQKEIKQTPSRRI